MGSVPSAGARGVAARRTRLLALLLATVGVAACTGGTGEGGDITAGLAGPGAGGPLPGDGDPGDPGGGAGPGGGGGDGGPADPPTYPVGEVLAELELGAPAQASFTLRGTIPVPPALFPMASGHAPFAVRDPQGVETPAQVEVVSRYAHEGNGADVVEVLAQVARPSGVQTGDRIRYQVVWAPHERGAVDVQADVQALVSAPGSVVLRARDVFGHEYRADLLRDLREENGELRRLRDGGVAHQVRTHEVQVPVQPTGGAQGTLPHFFGVHSFVTLWDGAPWFSLDLRVHNGSDGVDPGDPLDDPLGKVYFRDVELVLPAGWQVVAALEDPMQGVTYPVDGGHNAWPIVRPMDDGTLHVMLQQGQFHRRLVVARTGYEVAARALVEEAWLAFCRKGQSPTFQELFSWWNPQTARYFPQKEALPDLWHLDEEYVRGSLASIYANYEAALRDGVANPWPVVVPNLGWAHPWGINIGYAHGGDEIFLYDGIRTSYAASQEGYRYFQLVHRMMTERHPTALYDDDGEAFTLEDWLLQGPDGPYVPTYIWTQPVLWINDPFGFGASPDFQRQAVANEGLAPPYEGELAGFEAIDRAHLVRYTRSPKVLAWLGNDALAKDDIRLQGELQRVGYTRLPQNFNGDHIVTGLLHDRLQVDQNPHQGMAINRGEGWGIDVVAAAYCLGEPTWRSKARGWFYDVLELLEDGASDCTGILTADPNLDQFQGEYRARQSISAAILQNALWSVRASVFGERDPQAFVALSEVLERDVKAMISDLVWNEQENAPWFYVALGPYDLSEPEFCAEPPPDGFQQIDSYQVWSAFAYGYRLTGDPDFLTHASWTLGASLSTPALENENYGTVENRAALMALVQQLFE